MRHAKTLSVFLVLWLLSLAGIGLASAQTFNAIVNTGKLNVRQGPAPSFASIAQLPNRTGVTLLGRNDTASWVEISTGAVRGWVNARYLATAVNLSTLPQTWSGTVQPAPLPVPFSATVNTSFLNLRQGPGANFSILRTLARGQSMTLQGRNADARWVQVVLPDGLVGWVSARYLSMSISAASLPLASTTGVVPGAPQPVPVTGQTGVVSNSVAALNVRQGPGPQFAAFTTLASGTGVSLVARSADGAWLLVQLADGRTGWVSSAFISTSFPLASLPIR
jgi:uncharacterized protein YraI